MRDWDEKRLRCQRVFEAIHKLAADGEWTLDSEPPPPMALHLLASGWKGLREAPPNLRRARLGAAWASTLASLRAAPALADAERDAFTRLAWVEGGCEGPAPFSDICPIAACGACTAAVPWNAGDACYAVAGCANGHWADRCIRTLTLVPLLEDRWTCQGCGLSARVSAAAFPSLCAALRICPLCDVVMSKY